MAIDLVTSMKLMLITSGVLSIGVIFNMSLPLVLEIISTLPLLWPVIVSLLKPPYLYLLINCIILTIVATSKFQSTKSAAAGEAGAVGIPRESQDEVVVSDRLDGVVVEEKTGLVEDVVNLSSPVVFGYVDSPTVRNQSVTPIESPSELKNSVEVVEAVDLSGLDEADKENYEAKGDNNEFVIARSEWIPPKRDNPNVLSSSANYSVLKEKPLASSRLGRRRSTKTNPEGRAALGVSKPRTSDTLESTWRNITEGRAMPLTRHLRKSDTWKTQGRKSAQDLKSSATTAAAPTSSPVHVMRKSETFNNRTSQLSPSSGGSSAGGSSSSSKLRREPSLSQDDLNRRVEAFIRKFNEDIRLQRQESFGAMSQDDSNRVEAFIR